MITCFIGLFNDMLTETNGTSILFRKSKQTHMGRFRNGIHWVGVGDLLQYHVPGRHHQLRCCCFFAPCTHPVNKQAFHCPLRHVEWYSAWDPFVVDSHAVFHHPVAQRQLDESFH